MNPSTRRLLCWALGAAAATMVMSCSRPKPDPPFVEGEIAPPGSPQLFQDTQSSLELAPADVELLRRLEGLRLLVRKKDGQLNYLSPATAEWRRMNGAVDWKAASGAKFDPESAPCARAAKPAECVDHEVGIRMSAVQAEYRDLGFRDLDRGESLARVGDALTSVVSLVEDNLPQVEPRQQYRLVRAAATARAAQLDPETVLKIYEGGAERTPAYYSGVWRNSRSIAAVKDINQRVGTAFLVAPDWVVTCRHVVEGRDVRYLKVVFDYEEGEDGEPRTGTECGLVSDPVIASEPNLDLAALRFRCPRRLAPPLSDRVVRFSERVAERDEPVYAVGHPRGDFKKVADNARLRFPYQVTEPTLRIINETIQVLGEKYDDVRPHVPKMLTDLRAWYQLEGQYYFYRTPGERWRMRGVPLPVVPVAGFDTNTFRGNSGSAVFSGRDHTVLGIVFAGAEDSARLGPCTFYRHEAGVPAIVLRQWMRSKGIVR